MENNFNSSSRSSFKTGDSCINQLLPITHEICKSLGDGYKVRAIFFDMSSIYLLISLRQGVASPSSL